MHRISLFLCLAGLCLAQKSAQEVIASYDSDGDGQLALAELEQLHAELDLRGSAARLLQLADGDGDGGLDVGELARLMECLRERRPQRASRISSPVARSQGYERLQEVPGAPAMAAWLFRPEASNEPLPLVLCLHGKGGRTEAGKVLARAASQRQFPCFVLAPAVDSGAHGWAAARGRSGMIDAVIELVETLLDAEAIDPERVYVTGQSMGGFGTFAALSSAPQLFAAAIPVCGGGNTADAPRFASVPLWAFHGDEDPTVPVERSRELVAALQEAGGTPLYSELRGVKHNAWTPAYSDPETWAWLFAQRRSATSSD